MLLSKNVVGAIACALGVFAALALALAQSNYVPNGDFAAPLTRVTKILLHNPILVASTNNMVTRDALHGHNAPGCLRIKAASVGDVKSKCNRVVVPITINGSEAFALGATQMQLKFWLRSGRADGSNSAVFARCEAFLDHAPWTMVSNGFKTYPPYNRGAGTCDTVWRECVMDNIPVATSTVYNFHFLIDDTASEILVDDITFMISATNVPETPALRQQHVEQSPRAR